MMHAHYINGPLQAHPATVRFEPIAIFSWAPLRATIRIQGLALCPCRPVEPV